MLNFQKFKPKKVTKKVQAYRLIVDLPDFEFSAAIPANPDKRIVSFNYNKQQDFVGSQTSFLWYTTHPDAELYSEINNLRAAINFRYGCTTSIVKENIYDYV